MFQFEYIVLSILQLNTKISLLYHFPITELFDSKTIYMNIKYNLKTKVL
jgi:hypothetical protein